MRPQEHLLNEIQRLLLVATQPQTAPMHALPIALVPEINVHASPLWIALPERHGHFSEVTTAILRSAATVSCALHRSPDIAQSSGGIGGPCDSRHGGG